MIIAITAERTYKDRTVSSDVNEDASARSLSQMIISQDHSHCLLIDQLFCQFNYLST